MTKVPDDQRASVLQGGGSLDAHEARDYQAIYENIRIRPVGQFEIGKIKRVNRKNDQHTISDKVF